MLCGLAVMVQFLRAARRVEPFTPSDSSHARRARAKFALTFVKTKKLARRSGIDYFEPSPNFARACGRVSIGGHPDKRPDSRLRKRLYFLAPATGSRRRNRRTRSQRGTRLKATTEGLFWYCRRQCRDTEKACPSLPAVRNGISLIRTKAAIDGDASSAPHVRDARIAGDSPGRLAPPRRIREKVAMTARIREFLKQRNEDGPCLVVDLDVVRENTCASPRRCRTPRSSTR